MNNAFMGAAIAEGERGRASRAGGPFGAVVVRNGEIIARSHNTVLADCDATAHAEVNAIRAACQHLGRCHLDDCELYTSCEPCPMCLGAICWARLKAVYFAADRFDAARAGFDDAEFYEEIAKPVAERRIRFVQAGQAEAAAMMVRWRDQPLAY